jgi:hypothetical protein
MTDQLSSQHVAVELQIVAGGEYQRTVSHGHRLGSTEHANFQKGLVGDLREQLATRWRVAIVDGHQTVAFEEHGTETRLELGPRCHLD